MSCQKSERPKRPFVVGAVLLDEWAASPNMGETIGDGVNKAARMKVLRTAEGFRPVLSGQSVGSWHRDVLQTRFRWLVSNIVENVSSADTRSMYTQCQPINYAEDDGRGYLAAFALGSEKKKLALTTKRPSPFKFSFFQSVIPVRPHVEWGILARALEQIGDGVHNGASDEVEKLKENLIWKAEIAAVAYEGAFSLSCADLGVFTVGRGRDLLSQDDLLQAYKLADGKPFQENKDKIALDRFVGAKQGTIIAMPTDERLKRAKALLLAVADLEGGAHMTRRLRTVAPGTALIAFMDGGNSLPSSLFYGKLLEGDSFNNQSAQISINAERVTRVLMDYADRLMQDSDFNVFFGTFGTGSIANEQELLDALKNSAASHLISVTVDDGKGDVSPTSDRSKPVRILICSGPRRAFQTAASSIPADWFAAPESAQIAGDDLLCGQELLDKIASQGK